MSEHLRIVPEGKVTEVDLRTYAQGVADERARVVALIEECRKLYNLGPGAGEILRRIREEKQA